MIKRKQGLTGLAQHNAKRQGMYQVPKRYKPQGGGEEEYPAFLTRNEMALLKQQGGKGQMTPYGIPSFEPEDDAFATDLSAFGGSGDDVQGAEEVGSGSSFQNDNQGDYSPGPANSSTGTQAPPKKKTYNFSYDSSKSLTENIGRIDVVGWLKSLPDAERPEDIRFETDPAKIQEYLKNNPKEAGDAVKQQGGPAAVQSMNSEESKKADAYAADRKEDYENKEALKGERKGFLDEYEGYKGEAKDLGGKSQALTEGVMTDASGKVEGQEGYDKGTASMQGGFAGDVKKLGAYESQFGEIAKGAKDRGDKAETDFGTAAESGASTLEGLGTKYKDITGQGIADAAAGGKAGFDEGASDVGAVKDQFGKKGFQKDLKGMSEQALSGDIGQRQAGMLKGRMEEQRMASQKGSEEKLRREMAQSGASPAEIASKVAQFQRQSASQQQQAGRSEALSSQLQGQQMGQSQLSQAAQLKGQEAGMAGQQASLASQQASLRGKGAAMQMQGQTAQQNAQLSSLQGQSSMAQAGAGMRMQGVQGAAALGFQGASQQGTMLGQGMGAVQAAGGARQQQMGGIDQQSGLVDQQAEFTQAQLQDTVAQQTEAYSEEQARLTRSAQGTPDDPRYRPPAESTPAVAPADGSLPPGTTTAPPPPGATAAPVQQATAFQAKPQGLPSPPRMMAQGQGGQQALMQGGQQGLMNQQGTMTPQQELLAQERKRKTQGTASQNQANGGASSIMGGGEGFLSKFGQATGQVAGQAT